MNKYHKPLYADAPVAIRQKLSALWASVMLCYVYGDFFGLFSPGKLMRMNAGEIGPLGQATPAVLVGMSVMMAIPALMIFLSLVLPPAICRWASITFGIAYSCIMILTLPGAPPYYLFFAVLEISMTLLIAVTAWRWPKAAS